MGTVFIKSFYQKGRVRLVSPNIAYSSPALDVRLLTALQVLQVPNAVTYSRLPRDQLLASLRSLRSSRRYHSPYATVAYPSAVHDHVLDSVAEVGPNYAPCCAAQGDDGE